MVDRICENKEDYVQHLRIPKKRGGYRTIVAPNEIYKEILRTVSLFLQSYYKEHSTCHGFVKGKNIVSNAKPHLKQKSIGTVDIEDFFDNVTESAVRNCLLGNTVLCNFCPKKGKQKKGMCSPSLYKNRDGEYIGLCPEVTAMVLPDKHKATLSRIADLCTYKGSTPQGFPTSPVLANLVMKGFDERMNKFCKSNNLVYTRYADDLAFSSESLTKNGLANVVVPKVKSLLYAYGFNVNRKKLRFRHQGMRLEVCGIVVNEKLSLSQYQLRMYRAMVHNATVKDPQSTSFQRWMELMGFASYLYSANKRKGKKYINQLKKHKEAAVENGWWSTEAVCN